MNPINNKFDIFKYSLTSCLASITPLVIILPFFSIHVHSFQEFCEQGDLWGKMEELRKSGGAFTESYIIRMATQLTEALHYIHSQNILHRDIKPSNIFLTENGDVKIGDFGISKLMTSSLASTAVGTPQYMSPERCKSKPYTYKSDMWAMGCVLFETATLRSAFEADSFFELVRNIVSEQPGRLPSHFSQVDHNNISAFEIISYHISLNISPHVVWVS